MLPYTFPTYVNVLPTSFKRFEMLSIISYKSKICSVRISFKNSFIVFLVVGISIIEGNVLVFFLMKFFFRLCVCTLPLQIHR